MYNSITKLTDTDRIMMQVRLRSHLPAIYEWLGGNPSNHQTEIFKVYQTFADGNSTMISHKQTLVIDEILTAIGVDYSDKSLTPMKVQENIFAKLAEYEKTLHGDI